MPVTEASDAQLIERSLSGSSTAWETLLSRYERLIYYAAYKAGADKDEAADVFQAVCMIWLQELGRLRDPTRLGAWLVTITRRECWARWRHNRNDVDGVEADQVPDLESPEVLAGLADDARAVRDAVQELPQPCRRLIWLLYFDPAKPSYEEIGRKLHVSMNSIGPMRGRCLKQLREMLGKKGW